jgi:hypothetical protein
MTVHPRVCGEQVLAVCSILRAAVHPRPRNRLFCIKCHACYTNNTQLNKKISYLFSKGYLLFQFMTNHSDMKLAATRPVSVFTAHPQGFLLALASIKGSTINGIKTYAKPSTCFDLLGGVIKGVILKFLFILGFCLEERCALEFREVIAEFLRSKKLAHFSNERGQFGGELRPLFRSPCKVH